MKKIYDLIPLIQKTTKMSLDQHKKLFPPDLAHIRIDRRHLKKVYKFFRGKWTLEIIYLIDVLGSPHYNELKKALTGISSRILTDRLRFLEKGGFIQKIIHEDIRPIGISYKLSEFGEGFYHLFIPLFLYLKSF